ncbi:ATP-binding protein [Stappia sp. F7233]|uniref:ATP-binding protein n=1 Tax=Stappia albiluteola TaxID=2758565 RepID=A0A839AHX3_9HYPH|nr:ATP-binding protein [Stappia albiluteola]MBA5777442.1 ATP-binding protein [Stappia albiluteola]MBA5777480.1 ATP-binding protein [Stappia albiluteola]MBA5778109.1 ATP-binding protein [Stappia albiluteola]MBA5778114.1 ATP-binding protein [Stappia albiluteola]
MDVNSGDTAPIRNVSACMTLVRSLQDRHPLQPNLGVFAGFSGYGKSVAALFVQNKTDAAYVEVSDTWTKKKLLTSILAELGRPAASGTLADLEDEIIAILARDPRRPLIIDEADKLVDRKMIELVRMIAKKSNVPVLLIGEELFPKKLEGVDRFRDLVLTMGYAQPCDLNDTRVLARTLYPQIAIADDLLDKARSEAEGRVRRIGNTLHAIAIEANVLGVSRIGLDEYRAGRGYFSRGHLPSRREAA